MLTTVHQGLGVSVGQRHQAVVTAFPIRTEAGRKHPSCLRKCNRRGYRGLETLRLRVQCIGAERAESIAGPLRGQLNAGIFPCARGHFDQSRRAAGGASRLHGSIHSSGVRPRVEELWLAPPYKSNEIGYRRRGRRPPGRAIASPTNPESDELSALTGNQGLVLAQGSVAEHLRDVSRSGVRRYASPAGPYRHRGLLTRENCQADLSRYVLGAVPSPAKIWQAAVHSCRWGRFRGLSAAIHFRLWRSVTKLATDSTGQPDDMPRTKPTRCLAGLNAGRALSTSCCLRPTGR